MPYLYTVLVRSILEEPARGWHEDTPARFRPPVWEQLAPIAADARADLLLAQFEQQDPTVGHWAVRYLVDDRGGLTPLRQLLRLVSQRPDTFVENLQLVYGVSVGELERAWRAWLERLVAEDKRQREGGVREGPLIRDRDRD